MLKTPKGEMMLERHVYMFKIKVKKALIL